MFLTGRYGGKRAKLSGNLIITVYRRNTTDTLAVHINVDPHPPPPLTHHYQTYIDKFLPFNVRHVADYCILI